jgi:carboxyl-terminal processing protease
MGSRYEESKKKANLHLTRSLRWLSLLLTVVPLFALLTESCAQWGIGLGFGRPVLAQAESGPDVKLLEEAWKTIQKVYVDRSALNSQDLTYGAISGMVEALGDSGHSTFLSPEMLKMQRDSTAGKFEGIGAEVRMKGGQLVIVAPLDGSPAQRAGLKAGDVILKVDGRNISGLPLVKSVEKILGPAGTRVALTIITPSDGFSRDVTLVRASVKPHNVTWQTVPGSNIAFLRIAMFSKGVAKGLRESLEEITRVQLKGVVLDLRNNPGGLLSEAIGVASQFLSGGNVLLERDARGKVTPVHVQKGGRFTGFPLLVLINLGSASGAEIVAGALHDAGRAKLVGETTFGTGTVLEEFPLSDGSALLLAVEEWLTPQGHTIWHRGVTPDVAVSLEPGSSPLTPEGIRGYTPKRLSESGDTQFLRALKILEQEMVGPHRAGAAASGKE